MIPLTVCRAHAGSAKGRSTWRRVAPWASTTYRVIHTVNNYEHHENTVRGAARADHNMLRTVAGDFGAIDRAKLADLAQSSESRLPC